MGRQMKPYIARVRRTIYRGVICALQILTNVIAILVASARPPSAENELSSPIRSGILNYRTGNLDDGTDPYGWYEED